jgi:hypothetical protein
MPAPRRELQITEYDNQLRQLAEIEVNSDLESAMDSLVAAKENLSAARASQDFSAVKDALADVKGSVDGAMERMEIPQELAQQIAEADERSPCPCPVRDRASR